MAVNVDLPVACPAGEPINAVRERGGAVPGVRCRIEHNTLDAKRSGRSIAGFCCAAPADPRPGRRGGGTRSTCYTDCPTWQYEKLILELGQHSLGDPDRLAEANERAYRSDLTGSEYGDLSIMEEVEAAVQRSAEYVRERMNLDGSATFHTGNE